MHDSPDTNETPDTANDTSAGAPGPADAGVIKERVVEMIRTCYDPEIPVNVYDLGLIYSVDIDDAGAVDVKMTLTSPACPVAGSMPPEIEHKVSTVEGVTSASVEVVWDPPWSPDLMTEAAKLELGLL
jgi:FeS assembly SUF system protein